MRKYCLYLCFSLIATAAISPAQKLMLTCSYSDSKQEKQDCHSQKKHESKNHRSCLMTCCHYSLAQSPDFLVQVNSFCLGSVQFISCIEKTKNKSSEVFRPPIS